MHAYTLTALFPFEEIKRRMRDNMLLSSLAITAFYAELGGTLPCINLYVEGDNLAGSSRTAFDISWCCLVSQGASNIAVLHAGDSMDTGDMLHSLRKWAVWPGFD